MSNSQPIGAIIPGDVHLRIPNYVNGRPLTAEDLKGDRDALLARLEWLGKAAGYGIINGLTVKQSSSTAVQVQPGAGINRLGELIVLPEATTLTLTPPSGQTAILDGGLFAECDFNAGAPANTLPGGAYLLVVAPVQQRQGLTAVRSAGDCASSTSCTAKWLAEGLQFKSIRLSAFAAQGQAGRTQNLLAHFCFGSEALSHLADDPFTFGDDFTGLDGIAQADLTNCDLPLAVFFWTDSQRLAFVDAWSARRRLVAPAALDSWTGLLSEKRVSLAQARFLQFQAQLGQITRNQSTVRAGDIFRRLPPVGFLPLMAPTYLLQQSAREISQLFGRSEMPRTSSKQGELDTLVYQQIARQPGSGFDLLTFFNGALPQRLGLIDADSADFFLQRSWYDDAIDLDDGPNFDVYFVRDLWDAYLAQRLPAELTNAIEKRRSRSPEQALLADGLMKAAGDAGLVPNQLYAMFVKRVHAPTYYNLPDLRGDRKQITGKVTLWHTYLDSATLERQRVLESLAFQAQNDYPNAKITVEGVSRDELVQRLATSVAAGVSPDLVLAGNGFLGQLIRGGVIQPVDSYHTPDANVFPNAYQSLTLDGKLYGVPLSSMIIVLYYNNDRLPNPPQDLGELTKMVKKQRGIAIPLNPYFLYGFFTAFGGRLMASNGACTADQGGFAEAMQYLQNISSGAQFYENEQDAADDFAAGKVDMLVHGPWILGELRQKMGDSLGAVPLPNGPGGPARPLGALDGFYLVSGSDNPAGAVVLAEYLTTSTAQETFTRDSSFVPVRSDVSLSDPLTQALTSAAAQATPYPLIPQFDAWWTPFGDMLTAVLKEGKDPQEEVDIACVAMDQANQL